MNAAAIIAEYNPFHKGHAYHIDETKKATNADCIIALMSGNFVQRGTPAIFDKYTRAHSAILAGADLVLELPVIYATGSAEFFAENSIKILNRINGINYISFGVEHEKLEDLTKIANLLTYENEEFKLDIKKHLNEGDSIAVARGKALENQINGSTNIFTMSNNILGVEYLKALKKTSSSIKPLAIKRIGNNYNDIIATSDFPSATAIRKMFLNGDLANVNLAIPNDIFIYFKNIKPLFENDFSIILNHALLNNYGKFNEFLDVDDKLANRIENCMGKGAFYSFSDLTMLLKSKNYTYTRISRVLTHIMLGIKKNDVIEPEYCRVLGFNKNGSKFIKENKNTLNSILFTDANKIKNTLSEKALGSLEKDIYASNIYRMAMSNKHGIIIPDEYRHKPEII